MTLKKHLHELLGEDQEPFLLNSFISERSFLVRRRLPINSRPDLLYQSPALRKPTFSGNARKKSWCFFSPTDSPDPRGTPIWVALHGLHSPNTPNSVFLPVPEKTAALLLESARRIQRRSLRNSKPSSTGLPGFQLFGSLLKKLTNRNYTEKANQRSEIASDDCVCSDDDERHCSVSWFDAESSTGDLEERDEGVRFDEEFCGSPFRFALQTTPPSGHRTPEITSTPVSSPARRDTKLKDKKGDADPEALEKLTVDEEEKEQCSPVCVLDPPFDDDIGDDDAHGHGDQNIEDFDYDSSFATVQRAKQELLRKLYRFEKLAELDPVELERRLLEQDGEEEEDDRTNNPMDGAGFPVEEVRRASSYGQKSRLAGPGNFKVDREVVVGGLCRSLQQWKEADFTMIDAAIELDMRTRQCGWTERDRVQVAEVTAEIEAAIFGSMVEELAEGLACFH
ncbi:hypothetical protein SAY87_026743 [Trapa incisa]|uniref:DUF4378 domain-containing protein n=1 Tax=Trapa incisa TaxID=236973 RepID=A0AAN7H1P0_9MYRT|nr:hypothetical protein SAY87_026743 [Trapa incisa]